MAQLTDLKNVIVTPSMIQEYLEKKSKEQKEPEKPTSSESNIMQFQEP